MQLVLCNNRIVAHGENFLAMGGVVINTETRAKYENATVAECEGCPSDINEVGYEYHAGTFVPCAPYGKGNNNGFFMEVCETCATPRSSGIPIKKGLKTENFHESVTAAALGGVNFLLMWENPNPMSNFPSCTIPITETAFFFIVEYVNGQSLVLGNFYGADGGINQPFDEQSRAHRTVIRDVNGITFGDGYYYNGVDVTPSLNNNMVIPAKIYRATLEGNRGD